MPLQHFLNKSSFLHSGNNLSPAEQNFAASSGGQGGGQAVQGSGEQHTLHSSHSLYRIWKSLKCPIYIVIPPQHFQTW